eukprot:SAG22_NODE_125_length_18883_cov_12.351629_24_plen_56_part_00
MKYEQAVLSNVPMHKMVVVSYCHYGFWYQKNTDVWTNDKPCTFRTLLTCYPPRYP